MRPRRLLMVGFSVFGLTLAATGPAEAATSVNWGPLTASYKNVKRVEASGKFYIERNAYATNKITLNDPSNDGNNVLATTTYYFWEWDSLCDGGKGGTCWRIDLRKSTGEYNFRNTPVTKHLLRPLHSEASRVRGATVACAQMGWPVPDKCSATAYPTLDY